MTSYLTAAAARALAATLLALPGIAALLALDDATLGAILLTSSMDIDLAMRYQGRKYDLKQDMEFPRIAFGQPVTQFGVTLPGLVPLSPDAVVWDWDWTNSVAIIPPNVQLATLYQSAWLMQPKYSARIEAIRSGLVMQRVGTADEMFAKTDEIPGGFTGLGDRAHRIMDKYRLKVGRAL